MEYKCINIVLLFGKFENITITFEIHHFYNIKKPIQIQ